MARRKSGKKSLRQRKGCQSFKLHSPVRFAAIRIASCHVCTFDKKLKIGEASCGMCKESCCTKIDFLTEAIDLYSERLDACEAANCVPYVRKEEKTVNGPRGRRGWSIIDSD